ncbi:hypothetical protein SNR37_003035 [Agarivorans aestuarii]|uniref:Peptidase M15A C-terminal domain-containing protein n=1 Tax=Agarivorans aestuarii TaxID=1563703 RepID=A0ABU7G3M6_9ALTE|nr:hypothetical protein [Agarivorans aestuarii]MEE1673609.1 hypothetical protein [Agarivorans aestuarii]
MDLVNWHKTRHPNYLGINRPNMGSMAYLEKLQETILIPISNALGQTTVTYGFTSFELLQYIKKHSPGDMAPDIDQHAAMELNSRKNPICKRDGAACDILVEGYEHQMHLVAQYVCKELPFDRLYFYGKDCPLHVSIGPKESKYALIRMPNTQGVRVNSKSATGDGTTSLFEHL